MFPPQGELFFTINPFSALMILDELFGVQHVMEQRTTPPGMQGGEFFEVLAQRRIVRWLLVDITGWSDSSRRAGRCGGGRGQSF